MRATVYRTALNLASTNNASEHDLTAKVLYDAQRLPHPVVMCMSCLRYLARMFAHAPPLVR
eukprot:4562540-Pyramimonas_sp.AAC.1